MASDEFSIIEEYFSSIGPRTDNTRLGPGDDAAVMNVPAGCQLVCSMDTLISGVHFLPDTAPGDVAWKALAVNLSDLAAMAADPACFLLSLSLPDSDEAWLKEFSGSLKQIAEQFQVELIGGDTCRGSLSITIQAMGFVPADGYVTRAGAGPGDLILVSGKLGDAALGLAQLQGQVDLPDELRSSCVDALRRPRPRVELVPFLRESASAAIDLSDGLQADLGHILEASGYGAKIDRDRLPVNDWIPQANAWHHALAAGDDYEICCTVPSDHQAQIESWNRDQSDCPLTIIGEITESGYNLLQDGQTIDMNEFTGYRHFA